MKGKKSRRLFLTGNRTNGLIKVNIFFLAISPFFVNVAALFEGIFSFEAWKVVGEFCSLGI